MSLTTSQKYTLAADLTKIGETTPYLPIDVTKNTNTNQTPTKKTPDATEPVDFDAIEQSQKITLAEAVIASTTEYWLGDQTGFTLPPQLEPAPNRVLETTAARCLILRQNLDIIANHPNIDRIAADIAAAVIAIEWATEQGRLDKPTHRPPTGT